MAIQLHRLVNGSRRPRLVDWAKLSHVPAFSSGKRERVADMVATSLLFGKQVANVSTALLANQASLDLTKYPAPTARKVLRLE